MPANKLPPSHPHYDVVWRVINTFDKEAFGYICSILAKNLTEDNAKYLEKHLPNKNIGKLLAQAKSEVEAAGINSLHDVDQKGVGPHLEALCEALKKHMQDVAQTISAEAFAKVVSAYANEVTGSEHSPDNITREEAANTKIDADYDDDFDDEDDDDDDFDDEDDDDDDFDDEDDDDDDFDDEDDDDDDFDDEDDDDDDFDDEDDDDDDFDDEDDDDWDDFDDEDDDDWDDFDDEDDDDDDEEDEAFAALLAQKHYTLRKDDLAEYQDYLRLITSSEINRFEASMAIGSDFFDEFSELDQNVEDGDDSECLLNINHHMAFEHVYHGLWYLILHRCHQNVDLFDLAYTHEPWEEEDLDPQEQVPQEDANGLCPLSKWGDALIHGTRTYKLPWSCDYFNKLEDNMWPEFDLIHEIHEIDDDLFGSKVIGRSDSPNMINIRAACDFLARFCSAYQHDIRYLTASGMALFLNGNYKLAAVFFSRVLYEAKTLNERLTANWQDNPLFSSPWGFDQDVIAKLNQAFDHPLIAMDKGLSSTNIKSVLKSDEALLRDPALFVATAVGSKSSALSASSVSVGKDKSQAKGKGKASGKANSSVQVAATDEGTISYNLLCASYASELMRCVALAKLALNRCVDNFSSVSACSGELSYQGRWLEMMQQQKALIDSLYRRFVDRFAKEQNRGRSSCRDQSMGKYELADKFDAQLKSINNEGLRNLFSAIATKDPDDREEFGHDWVRCLCDYYYHCSLILFNLTRASFCSHPMFLNQAISSILLDYSTAVLDDKRLIGKLFQNHEPIFVNPFVNKSVAPQLLEQDQLSAVASTSDSTSATSVADADTGADTDADTGADTSAGTDADEAVVSDVQPRFRSKEFVGLNLKYHRVLSSQVVILDDVENWISAYHFKRCLQWCERYNPFTKIVAANSELGMLRCVFLENKQPQLKEYMSFGCNSSMSYQQWSKSLSDIILNMEEEYGTADDCEEIEAEWRAFLKKTYFALIPTYNNNVYDENTFVLECHAEIDPLFNFYSLGDGSFTSPLSARSKAILEKLPFKVAFLNDERTVAMKQGKTSHLKLRPFERQELNNDVAAREAHHFLPRYIVVVFDNDEIIGDHVFERALLLKSYIKNSLGIKAAQSIVMDHITSKSYKDGTSLFKLKQKLEAMVHMDCELFEPNSKSKLANFNKRFVEGRSGVLMAAKDLAAFARHCKFDARVSLSDIFDYKISYKSKLKVGLKKNLDDMPDNDFVDTDAVIGENMRFLKRFDVIAGESCYPSFIDAYMTPLSLEAREFDGASEVKRRDYSCSERQVDLLERHGATAGFLTIKVEQLSSVRYKGKARVEIAKKLALEINEFMQDLKPGEAPHYDFVNESFTYAGFAAGTENIYVDYFIWDLKEFLQKAKCLNDSAVAKAYGIKSMRYYSFSRYGAYITLF